MDQARRHSFAGRRAAPGMRCQAQQNGFLPSPKRVKLP